MRFKPLCAAIAVTLAAAGTAQSETFRYTADLKDINGFGGSASAKLVFDSLANTLGVNIKGSGFTPNMLHVQHIHGGFNPDGTAKDSITPTMAADDPANGGDGDGVIDLLEGAPLYGGILLSLFDEDDTGGTFGGFPVVGDDGVLMFDHIFDLKTSAAFQPGVTGADLLPLTFREIVIHGAFIDAGVGGFGDGTHPNDIQGAGYAAFVPVAAGEIQVAPVPLPAAAWMLVAGLGGLGALRARNKRAA